MPLLVKKFIVLLSVLSFFLSTMQIDLNKSSEHNINIIKIAAADDTFASLDSKGKVYVWGNFYKPEKMQPPENLPEIIDIAVGQNHIVALDKDGKLHGWGITKNGEIDFKGNLPKFVSICASTNQTTALTANGKVYKWGNLNEGGQKYVPGNIGKVTQIANGRYITAVITSDRSVYIWGMTDGKKPPVCKNPVMLAPLAYNTAILGKDGKIYGKIIREDYTLKHKEQPALGKVVKLFGAASNLAAIDDKGELTIWGDYTIFDNGQSVVDIPINLPDVSSVAFGNNSVLCLGVDGKVYQWGEKMYTIPDEINGYLDSIPEFENLQFVDTQSSIDVKNSAEFINAIQSGNKTINIKSNIRITVDSLYLNDDRTIIIDKNVHVSIETKNFSVHGTIINNGKITVSGLIGFFNESSQLGNIITTNTGEITYTYSDANLKTVKKFLDEKSVYTTLIVCASSEYRLMINSDYTIPYNKKLWLSFDCTLIVDQGVTLTINGKLETYNKPIINGKVIGTIKVETT